MGRQRISQFVIVVMLIISFLVGCGAPATTPAIEVPTIALTVPPTTTPIATLVPAPPTLPLTSIPAATTAKIESATATVQPAKASVEDFVFTSQALQGNLLKDSAHRVVQVVLPPGYATSNKRYPVIYYLHGYGGDDSFGALNGMRDWFLHQYNGIKGATGDLVTAVDQGVQLGETQEMILVFPNSGNTLGGSMYLSSPTIGDYETYLSKELIDYVDSHYRTLPQRESRGIAGCSMGADGAAHLGLKYPDVYAVAAAQSGTYFWDRDPCLLEGITGYTQQITGFLEILRLPEDTVCELAVAAAVAPNSDKAPLYFDMPYVIVNGKAEIDSNFIKKLKASDPRADVERYLQQSTRLNALLVQHAQNDELMPVGPARDFDKLLIEKKIAHEFDDSFINHCSYDMIPPMLKFMSDNLAGEKTGK